MFLQAQALPVGGGSGSCRTALFQAKQKAMLGFAKKGSPRQARVMDIEKG